MKNTHKVALRANPRFYSQAFKNMGWDSSLTSIREFVDNSIDAGASVIEVKWDLNKADATYLFQIKDNGTGVVPEMMEECFTTLGSNTSYQSNDISYYGVGCTAAITNMLSEGTAVIESVTKKNKKFQVGRMIWKRNGHDEPTIILETSESNDKSLSIGTTITISEVKANTRDTTLITHFATTYFPNFDNVSSLSKSFTMYVNNKLIEFMDPFYRQYEDRNGSSNPTRGLERKKMECTIAGRKVNLVVVKFWGDFLIKDQEDGNGNVLEKSILSSWDKNKNNKRDSTPLGKFKPRNSGLYLRVGGRYITTGGKDFPCYQDSARHNRNNRLRIEVQLPRDLMEVAVRSVNKSRADWDMENTELHEFYQQITTIINEFGNDWIKKSANTITPDHDVLAKKVSENLRLMLSGKVPPIVRGSRYKLIEKREFKGRDPNGEGVEPKDTGRPRGGNTHVKIDGGDNVVEYINNGAAERAVDFKREGSVFIIELNIDHPYIAQLPSDSNKLTKEVLNWWIRFNELITYADNLNLMHPNQQQGESYIQEYRELLDGESRLLSGTYK